MHDCGTLDIVKNISIWSPKNLPITVSIFVCFVLFCFPKSGCLMDKIGDLKKIKDIRVLASWEE